MEHLEEEYGHIDLSVNLITRESLCTPIQSPEEFAQFPHKHGWMVDESYNLVERKELGEVNRLDYSILLQSWLFFGLISLVVRDGNGPILPFEDLVRGQRKNKYLDTKKLPAALDRWEEWEKTDKSNSTLRMLRTEIVLELAYRVVRKNCAFDNDGPDDEATSTEAQPKELSTGLSLSLMVLGEVLSAAKARILDGIGGKMRGWQRDDEGGWGPPRYVLDKMRKKMWCPRTIHLLRGQLGSNATLLLAAFESHNKDSNTTDIHVRRECTDKACNVISEDETADPLLSQGISAGAVHVRYVPKHGPRCPGPTKCVMVGPVMEDVYDVLRESQQTNGMHKFPILKIKEQYTTEESPFEVMSWTPGRNAPRFATISHVWSDGLGNEENNQIYNCQLQFIKDLLKKVARENGNGTASQINAIPFWMDTLVIPVESQDPENAPPRDFKDLKRKAIQQIYHVFNASTDSIIIDRGLLNIDADGTPWKNVMKILASGWMRRLWTLQEAYLSRKLWITFKQAEEEHLGMEDLDDLIGQMVEKENLGSSFAQTARITLFHNIMGKGRNERQRDMNPLVAGGVVLVANTWRAVRWRTTSNPAHETLALATLLNLDYKSTSINQAGLKDRTNVTSNKDLELMMKDFWKTIDRRFPKSIPPGMIFLPGEKLSEKGFRWAPRTWMSAHEIDHPDPLSNFNYDTELEEFGLLVQYPGFLLHCQDRKIIIGTNHTDQTFTFPIDRDLLEWYTVELADKAPKTEENKSNQTDISDKRLPNIPHDVVEPPVDSTTKLAIILSRPRPRETPAEIGLLVEIYEERPSQKSREQERIIYYCRIIHRVRASRTKQPLYSHSWYSRHPAMQRTLFSPSANEAEIKGAASIFAEPSDQDKKICIGELVEADQQWCVDGFPPAPTKPEEVIQEEEVIQTRELGSRLLRMPTLQELGNLGKLLWKSNTLSTTPSGTTLGGDDPSEAALTGGRSRIRKRETMGPVGTASDPEISFLRRVFTGI